MKLMLRITWLAAAFLICAFVPACVWAQNFTVEQVMSSPFPDNLTAASHGERIAWVFDAKGVRNVWVADGPDFRATASHALFRGRWPGDRESAPDARRPFDRLCTRQ